MTGEDEADKWRVSWLVPCVMGSLPGLMSCKSRAEAFARNLQTKLRSLGGLIPDDETNGTQVEPASSVEINTHLKMRHEPQPIRDDEELYYDFDLASSSGSPASPDATSHAHDPPITQSFPVAMKDNLSLNEIARGQSIYTTSSTEPILTSDSTSEDPDSACSSGGEHESNSYVLEQGQSNYGSNTQSNEDDKRTAHNFVTLSITAIKLDDDHPDGSIDERESTAQDENNINLEEDIKIEELVSPEWGSLKLIDRFQVRKEKNKNKSAQDGEETESEMPEVAVCENSPRETRKSYFYSDEVDCESAENAQPKHIYRSSSLKTGKTPPGTPGRKKIVRFADVLGLDLEDVKHVCLDDLPTVPKSAYSDLDESAVKQPSENAWKTFWKPKTNLVAMFSQPYTSTTFLDRVRTNKVCLETAVANDDGSIKGQVRVLNLDFNKKVYVRYTINEWRTFVELETNYMVGSNDTLTDRFSFVIFGGDKLNLGQRIIFCIRYVTLEKEFWDNNSGQNYQFQCIQDCPTQQLLNMSLGFDDDKTSFLF